MKLSIIVLSNLLAVIVFLSFTNKKEISNCFISFKPASGLTALKPDRLPESSEKVRTVQTDSGDVDVTRVDGYRILYENEKNVPFVNLKVELSEQNSYETDKVKLIDNLKYSNSHSAGMETQELIERTVNGYKVFGLSRGTIETGSTLGIFIMFPGNGVTVYFYFNNLKPEFRNFKSLEDYKKQRDTFIEEYTKYLATCDSK